jgi:hypothetical protein
MGVGDKEGYVDWGAVELAGEREAEGPYACAGIQDDDLAVGPDLDA